MAQQYPDDDLRQAFRQSVAFDTVQEPGPPTAGVVLAWPDPAAALPLANFVLESLDIRHQDHAAEGQWVLKRGAQTVIVRIFVAREANAQARERWLDIATNTSMATSPFKLTPRPIGSLSAAAPRARDGNLIWFYYNVCGHIRGIDTPLDVTALALWLQARMAGSLVRDPAPYRPHPRRILVQPQVPAVGERVTLEVAAPDGRRAADYTLDFGQDPAALDLESEDDDRAGFRALRAGPTRVQVGIVDRATLLSVRVPVDVTIAP